MDIGSKPTDAQTTAMLEAVVEAAKRGAAKGADKPKKIAKARLDTSGDGWSVWIGGDCVATGKTHESAYKVAAIINKASGGAACKADSKPKKIADYEQYAHKIPIYWHVTVCGVVVRDKLCGHEASALAGTINAARGCEENTDAKTIDDFEAEVANLNEMIAGQTRRNRELKCELANEISRNITQVNNLTRGLSERHAKIAEGRASTHSNPPLGARMTLPLRVEQYGDMVYLMSHEGGVVAKDTQSDMTTARLKYIRDAVSAYRKPKDIAEVIHGPDGRAFVTVSGGGMSPSYEETRRAEAFRDAINKAADREETTDGN